MPISAGLREDIAVYRGFIGQQYFSIIIDCLRDSLELPLTGKTIFSSVKVLFFFVLFNISSYLCN